MERVASKKEVQEMKQRLLEKMGLRLENLKAAKVAKVAGRDGEVFIHMSKVISQDVFTIQDRDILSSAFNTIIAERRASIRVISAIEKKTADNEEGSAASIKMYRRKVQGEIRLITDFLESMLKNLTQHKDEVDDLRAKIGKIRAEFSDEDEDTLFLGGRSWGEGRIVHANLAFKCGRFKEALKFVQQSIAFKGTRMTEKEFEVLHGSCTKLIEKRLKSLDALDSGGEDLDPRLVEFYKEKIKTELSFVCRSTLRLLLLIDESSDTLNMIQKLRATLLEIGKAEKGTDDEEPEEAVVESTEFKEHQYNRPGYHKFTKAASKKSGDKKEAEKHPGQRKDLDDIERIRLRKARQEKEKASLLDWYRRVRDQFDAVMKSLGELIRSQAP
ncbi:OLC1v1009725C1 [Oldenlandia corymbosa var. corymbosa]|uniref:OLC1v1009725C1 n=1 Tax=Oldenlandia corymbosa var. corymbosa TaxID=529605 RepID=A0AAV1DQ55_OLDCO|nr:OLC1v1009725C1 [Oldenlandia corymbosa var. corymbosa]